MTIIKLTKVILPLLLCLAGTSYAPVNFSFSSIEVQPKLLATQSDVNAFKEQAPGHPTWMHVYQLNEDTEEAFVKSLAELHAAGFSIEFKEGYLNNENCVPFTINPTTNLNYTRLIEVYGKDGYKRELRITTNPELCARLKGIASLLMP